MNGKGDDPRPLSVDWETFSDNWDKALSKEPDTWSHFCSKQQARVFLSVGETCAVCGKREK